MKKPTLSVCILAKNEETNIKAALQSVSPVADEIIVVDTGSTDRTVEVAREFGAKVLFHPWGDDFAEARNAGLREASCDWILMLDADEMISAKMAQGLSKALKNSQIDGYAQPVVNIRDGLPIESVPILRLFRNRPAYRYEGRIHEQIDASIIAAGGKLGFLPLPIEHYGYNAAEDERKDRRNRNMRLLQKAVEERPEHHSAWYFLGLEYVWAHEFGRATDSFRQALRSGSEDSLHMIMAAHRWTQIELQRQRIERGLELARLGSDLSFARWDSALLTTQVALLEGDHTLALDRIAMLRKASPEDLGSLRRDPATLLNLEGAALWEKGEREKALRLWGKGVSLYPKDHSLAIQWVKHKVAVEGLGPGLNSALQAVRTAHVASACVGALLRAGETDEAGALAQQSVRQGLVSVFMVYGVACSQSPELAEQMVAEAGLEGAMHLATAAAWFDRPALLSHALEGLTEPWRTGFELILSGEPLPEELLWVADILMTRWAEIGCLPLLEAGARSLPGGPAAGAARAAWLAQRAGLTAQALEMALRWPDQPEALEVLGLAAYEHGDHEAAAHFLIQRVTLGAAAVGIYHKAAETLRRSGETDLARQVLEIGIAHRPQSPLLKQGLTAMNGRR